MENIKENIYEVKDILLKSPIRYRLEQEINIPFKNLISNNLHLVISNINILENNKNTPLKIAIVGEVKSGKSSLLNALIGSKISEVDVLESTSNIIEVVYGEDEYKENKNNVTKIRLDKEYLKKINLVDTPGLKSITTKNEKTTLNYIKNADLILFVIDSTHIGQEDICEVLDLICEYKKTIVGVINKADLLEDNKEEILEYIKCEYGIYIDDFFMISSYLEYQDTIGKNSIAKSTDLTISNNTELRKEFINLNKYIENIYENCENIKIDSINSSLESILHKDIINHYDYLKSILMLTEELKKYEKVLENKYDYISSKMDFEINDWVGRVFLNEELDKIKGNIENSSMYINENYINDAINMKKIELDKLFFLEWSECLKEVSNEVNEDIKKYLAKINYKNELIDTPQFKLDYDKTELNDILATVGTGAILGVTSGTMISIYSASLGSSATSITIGSALMTYCPPLLIAGTVTGAVAKLIYDKLKLEQKNKDILSDIDDFIEEIKFKIVEELKSGYNNSSKEIILTTCQILQNIKGTSMNKYEIENLIEEIEGYIKNIRQNITK
ncbi:MAG: dynamin family protein [Romboutsia sp.]